MKFQDLIIRSRKPGEPPYEGRLLCLDPGGTTGWALFQNLELLECGQLATPEVGKSLPLLQDFFLSKMPLNDLVYEDYRVYKWKAKYHANSELHTAKLIGIIEAVAQGIPDLRITNQMASVAKQWAPDEVLKDWGFFAHATGQRHARDAIRHGCYFISFGDRKQWHKRPGRTQGATVG